MNNELLETQNLNGHTPSLPPEPPLLPTMIEATAAIAPRFDSTIQAIESELADVEQAIEFWEKMAPQLYQMRKRLQLCEEVLSGKRKIESAAASEPIGDKPKADKRGGPRTFTKAKSDIITDAVLDEIVKYIASDQEYHKAKDIYGYLRERGLVPHLQSPMAFAQQLARVDQDVIVYNDHYTIAAWGLPDFGTPEHARRKALLTEDNRVTSFGKG